MSNLPSDCPVECLGITSDTSGLQRCWYRDFRGDVVALDAAKQHGKLPLLALFGRSDWLMAHFPLWSKPVYAGRTQSRLVQPPIIIGFDQAQAAAALITACCSKPSLTAERIAEITGNEQSPKTDFGNILSDILAEIDRACAKFPTWPSDPFHALAVVGEEYGELQKAVIQFTYEKHKGVTQEDIRAEAIQTAAMAIRWAYSLSAYAYKAGEQHSQHSDRS